MTASVQQIEEIYRVRFHRYLRVAEAITGDPDSGFDAVQDGFARALRYRHQFRGDASLSTWVWRCVINAAKAARPPQELPLEQEAADEGREDVSTSSIRVLIASLPDRQRLALFLRYYADLDYTAIAAVLGVRIGTVGATLNKAHAHIRRQLEEVPS